MLNKGETWIVVVNKRWALSTLGPNSKYIQINMFHCLEGAISQDKSYLHPSSKEEISFILAKFQIIKGRKKEGQYLPLMINVVKVLSRVRKWWLTLNVRHKALQNLRITSSCRVALTSNWCKHDLSLPRKRNCDKDLFSTSQYYFCFFLCFDLCNALWVKAAHALFMESLNC